MASNSSIYPCGLCMVDCETDCLQCSRCESWVHRGCVPMSAALLRDWSQERLFFLCPKCVYVVPSRDCGFMAFDCRYALERLEKAVMTGRRAELVWALKSERLMLRTYNVSLPEPCTTMPGAQTSDSVSLTIFQHLNPAMLHHHTPLAIGADGNCFYRAVSRALYGHEEFHLLLRLLVFLEIGENQAYYDSIHRGYVDLIKDVRVVTSTYHDFLMATVKPGRYAEMLHFYAASAVLGVTLRSYCPPTYNENLSTPLQRNVSGRGVSRYGVPAFTIMWTMVEIDRCFDFRRFVPNHFVVLADANQVVADYVDLTSPPMPTRPAPLSLCPAVELLSSGAVTRTSRPINKTVKAPAPVELLSSMAVTPPTMTTKQAQAPSVELHCRKQRLSLIKKGRSTHSSETVHQPPLVLKLKKKEGNYYTFASPNVPSRETQNHVTDSARHSDSVPLIESQQSSHEHGHPVSTNSFHFDTCSVPVAETESLQDSHEHPVSANGSDLRVPVDGPKTSTPTNLNSDTRQFTFTAELDIDQILADDTNLKDFQVGHISTVFQNGQSEISSARSSTKTIVEKDISNSAVGGHALPVDGFMTLNLVFSKITSCDSPLATVPEGRKDNVFFLVNNARNVERHSLGQKSEWVDDCGAWKKSPSPISYFVRDNDGKLTSVSLKNGQYCNERQVSKQRMYVPLEPQPAQDSVVVVHRNYASLKSCANYKRRITWIGSCTVACIEYKGKFSGAVPHGNAKLRDDPYIRTHGDVLDRIGREVKNGPPRAVYEKLKLNSSFGNIPKDLKQVQNKKFIENQKKKLSDGNAAAGTGLADNVLHLISSMQNSSFVQEIRHKNSHVPAIVLFTSDQIQDIKRFCCSGPAAVRTVICVDKTYNLGQLHVTATTFKHLGLTRKEKDHPLFLGPMFIHGNSNFNSFAYFFNTLKAELVGVALEPVFGSDAEAALRQALHHTFPSAPKLSCERHLRSNATDYLRDKVGACTKVRNSVLDTMFGPEGMSQARDDVTYEIRSEATEACIQDSVPGFMQYFNRTLKPLLDENHNCIRDRPEAHPGWTNNNSESMNHVLKMAVDWRPQAIPDLVCTLRNIVKGQYVDTERALLGRGEYRLSPCMKKFALEPAVWAKMTKDKKKNHWKKFMKGIVPVLDRPTVTSADGRLIVLIAPSAGKKPCQRKRKRNAKTTSISAKHRRQLNFSADDGRLSTVLESSTEQDG